MEKLVNVGKVSKNVGKLVNLGKLVECGKVSKYSRKVSNNVEKLGKGRKSKVIRAPHRLENACPPHRN